LPHRARPHLPPAPTRRAKEAHNTVLGAKKANEEPAAVAVMKIGVEFFVEGFYIVSYLPW